MIAGSYQSSYRFQRTALKGFTLIELVVTMIIIGILAVTILPRFTGPQGYEEYTYRTQAIAILRNVQTKAMQQSVGGCHDILVDATHLGIPDQNPCAANASFSNNYGDSDDLTRFAELQVDNRHQVSFSLAGSSAIEFTIGFDQMGRPDEDCAGGCDIEINGQDTLILRVESEGYIHAL